MVKKVIFNNINMFKTIALSLTLSFLFFGTGLAQLPNTVTVGSTTLDVRVVIQGNNETNGIDIPWEIQWGSDDHIWMTERYGRVSRLDPVSGTRTTILDLTNTVYASSESGLLGLQLHPQFATTPQVFLAYTYYDSGIKERIVRYDYNSTTGMLETPLILLDDIVGYTTHIGCRLLILPDNTLLATTGDVHQENTLVQDVNSLNGKVLRMNLDGTIPSDNPFGPTNYVYSLGHRNAQGLVLAPNGKLYSSEHGPSTNDEFNIIVAGGNYGWPDVEGFCNLSGEQSACASMTDYQDPLAIWYENSTIAPSDLIWYNHPAIPEWEGKMLMTVLKTKHLKEVEVDNVDGTSVVNETIWFQNTFERLRDILMAPDGRVFLATSGPSWGTSGTFENSIIELKNSAYISIGIEEQGVNLRTSIQPNPTTGIVQLVFPKQLLDGTFKLVDVAGREIRTGSVMSNRMELNLQELASGLYSITTIKDNYTSTERLVITE